MLAGVTWQPNRQTSSQACSPYFWNIPMPIRDPPWQRNGTPKFSHSPIQGPSWNFWTLHSTGCRHGFTPPIGATILGGRARKHLRPPTKNTTFGSKNEAAKNPPPCRDSHPFLEHSRPCPWYELDQTRHSFLTNFGRDCNCARAHPFHYIYTTNENP